MVGAKFKLRVACLGNSIGTVGICFNEYQDFDYIDQTGVQVIFPNGEYDGFSVEEQKMFLEYVGHDLNCIGYRFKNVMEVAKDFRNGYWKF